MQDLRYAERTLRRDRSFAAIVVIFSRWGLPFQSVTSYNPFLGNSEYTLTGRGKPEAVDGLMVAGNFFR